MSDKKLNIAIDGPGGAGKSTVAKLLAKRLNIIYIDTGAMYRAVALKALNLNLSSEDIQAVERMLSNTVVDLRFVSGEQRVFLDGKDVSTDIREHQISQAASVFSAIAEVRHKLVALQRQIASESDCVLDGRDIGSYVLPEAEFKFFLTADLDTRAQRRYLELQNRGASTTLDEVREDIRLRDERDSNRSFAPLVRAEGAVLINSSNLTAEQAAKFMYDYVMDNQKV